MVQILILAFVYTTGLMLTVGALVGVFGVVWQDTSDNTEEDEQVHKSPGEGMGGGSFTEGSALEASDEGGDGGE